MKQLHKSLPLLAIIFTIHLICWVVFKMFNMIISPDGYYYLSQAQIIQSNGLCYFINNNISSPYYWMFPLLLAFLKMLFGQYFISFTLAIQFVISCFSVLLISRIYRQLFKDECGHWIVIILFTFGMDIIQWDHYLLTDIYSLFFDIFFCWQFSC